MIDNNLWLMMWEVQLNHPMDEEKVLENYILPFLIFLILVNLREKLGMFSYNLNFQRVTF
jgi:hypothetical protein